MADEPSRLRSVPTNISERRVQVDHRGGGGGGNDGGMDDARARLRKVEDSVIGLDKSLQLFVKKEDLQTVERHLTLWIAGTTVTLMLAMLGTGIAIQQMTVSSFQGAAEVARASAPTAPPPPPQLPIIINVPHPAALPAPNLSAPQPPAGN